jgi:hypothetical protein
MFFGPQSATIVGAQPVVMHGEQLYDVHFQVDGESQARAARLGPETLYGVPKAGDRVSVRFVMETVTRIERL